MFPFIFYIFCSIYILVIFALCLLSPWYSFISFPPDHPKTSFILAIIFFLFLNLYVGHYFSFLSYNPLLFSSTILFFSLLQSSSFLFYNPLLFFYNPLLFSPTILFYNPLLFSSSILFFSLPYNPNSRFSISLLETKQNIEYSF